MFDYGTSDRDELRHHYFGGYNAHLDPLMYLGVTEEPIIMTAFVEYLLGQPDRARRTALCDQLAVTIDGPHPERIDLQVFENGELTPLGSWLAAAGLMGGEPVFLGHRFRFVASDVGESFDLDPAAVISRVLPHYRGFLHAWLDADSVRRSFPGAGRRYQNFLAHHMLDYFAYGQRTGWPMDEGELGALEYLASRRAHVIRHVLVARPPGERDDAPPGISGPYAAVEPALSELFELVVAVASRPYVAHHADRLVDALAAASHPVLPPTWVELGRFTPRLAELARFGQLDDVASSLENLHYDAPSDPAILAIDAQARSVRARLAEVRAASW